MRVLWLSAVSALLAICLLSSAASAKQRREPSPEEKAREAAEDGAGFEAITALHRQMDDDASGSVDLAESSDFVREELKVVEKEPANWRSAHFHVDNDEQISVEDLWSRWLRAKERNWTTEDVLTWLTHAVELPQYAEAFSRNAVDGRSLPRLATLNTSFLQHVIGVTNSVHRHKIQLKAMDVVLFGYRLPNSGYVKDLVMIALLSFFMLAYVVSRYQRASAQRQNKTLAAQMSELRKMEANFHQLQSRIGSEEAGKEAEERKSEEIVALRAQLETAERRLEAGMSICPLALQPLLRTTADRELARINAQKLDGLREMREAMEMVEKLRRKGTGVVNSLRLAISTDPGTESLDQTILRIKSRMEKTAAAMEESLRRWREIESLCGFPILGLAPQPPSLRPSASAASLNPVQHTPSVASSPNGLEAVLRASLAAVPDTACLLCHHAPNATAAQERRASTGPAYPAAFFEQSPTPPRQATPPLRHHPPNAWLGRAGSTRPEEAPRLPPHFPMDYQALASVGGGVPTFQLGSIGEESASLRRTPTSEGLRVRKGLGETGRGESNDSSGGSTEASSLPTSKSSRALFKPWKKAKA